MTSEPLAVDTDVLVIGSGAAGMYAAIEASRGGARVFLIDRSLIGRGGATVMAQMTVAVALGEEVPDAPRHHYDDTIAAGRGLCDESLAQLLCEEAPACIRELDAWGVGWARKGNHITATTAPGHDRARCVYVDFINTGPAVSKTLRTVMARNKDIRKAGDICITDLVAGSDGEIAGAVGWHVGSGAPVLIAAKATVLATGGLTRIYRRNSASLNMGGDGYALALRAGASLIDMEFVQFFPIGHLAPRLVGMDPIMWDPFRYKLGGRLLNGRMEEFTSRYGSDEDGKYVLPRDLATYAIFNEVEAGRGSPHGGAYLSFEHCSAAALRAAFGPVIDRLAANNIDLTRTPVEVAPIAHYHMGGVVADAQMQTELPGLFAAGEVVGGANGANRLSGNAITEALVFGRRAGRGAAARAKTIARRDLRPHDARDALDLVGGDRDAGPDLNTASMIARLQAIMADDVGPFRTAAKLDRALAGIGALADELGERPPHRAGAADTGFDLQRLEWFDLRNMLVVARAVAQSALARTESRGAHQREDFPQMLPAWLRHQRVRLAGGALIVATLLAAMLAIPAAIAQAGELPKRKPGLWELHWHVNDASLANAASELVTNTAKMCIDDTTDGKLAAAYDPCDPPLDFAFYAPQFTSDLVCEVFVERGVKAMSRSTISFAGDTAYRIEVSTRFKPALKGEGEYSGVRDGKWLGKCPADLRPGDLLIGDEPKFNVLEKHD
jgi:succinate dehydrogenase flavoprotein subunit